MLNPLSASLSKWSNTLKQFVGNLPMNCVNVFDNFERLALKGLSSGKMTHIISLSSSKMTHTIGAGEKHYRNTLVLLLSEMSFLQAGAQRCSVKGVFIEFSHN